MLKIRFIAALILIWVLSGCALLTGDRRQPYGRYGYPYYNYPTNTQTTPPAPPQEETKR